MSKGLPRDVRRFILAHVNSIPQLEVLLWLRARPDTAYTVEAVASEHRITEDMARSILEDLSANGFVQKKAGEPGADYAFEPGSAALAAQIGAVHDAYKSYRVAIIHLIYSKPSEEVRGFADAFRFRRDEQDG